MEEIPGSVSRPLKASQPKEQKEWAQVPGHWRQCWMETPSWKLKGPIDKAYQSRSIICNASEASPTEEMSREKPDWHLVALLLLLLPRLNLLLVLLPPSALDPHSHTHSPSLPTPCNLFSEPCGGVVTSKPDELLSKPAKKKTQRPETICHPALGAGSPDESRWQYYTPMRGVGILLWTTLIFLLFNLLRRL